MPMDDSLQFTTNKYSWDQYFALNQLKDYFFKYRVQMLDHIDCRSIIRAQQGEEIVVSLLIPTDISVASVLAGPGVDGQKQYSISTRTRSERPDQFLCHLRARCPIPGTYTLNAFGRSMHEESSTQESVSGQLLSMSVVVEARRDGVIENVPGCPHLYGSKTLQDCSLVSPLISPLAVRTTYEFAIEDLAPDAHTRTLPLYLWVGGQRGPEMLKKRDNNRIIYSVRKHLTALGDLNIAVKDGNSYGFLTKWEVS